METFLAATWRILAESGIYLLVGFGLAGLLHVLMARFHYLRSLLGPRSSRSVFLAALLGLPLPLCSCSVLPAALAVRREGASKGATTSFLISVPETDVVSIALTYALLGPVLAIYRPVAAVATAIVTGLAVNRVDRLLVGSGPTGAAKAECGCEGDARNVGDVSGRTTWVRRALHYGFVEMFDDMIVQLMLGIAVAGVLVVWLPRLGLFGVSGGSALTYAVMLAIGVPMYVCATASTPVAVGLIAGGISPGAAMVFLLAGPATNMASILVLRKQFGGWILGVYWGGIAVMTVLSGLVLDAVVGRALPLPTVSDLPSHGGSSPLHVAAAVAILLLFGASLLRKVRIWIRRRQVRGSSSGYHREDSTSHLRENSSGHHRENSGSHQHGPRCGHTAVRVEGMVYYLVAGTLQAIDPRAADAQVTASRQNPERCTPKLECSGHAQGNRHGPGCGHEAVVHDGHLDYLVDGRLHHPHEEHCDDHGPLEVVR